MSIKAQVQSVGHMQSIEYRVHVWSTGDREEGGAK